MNSFTDLRVSDTQPDTATIATWLIHLPVCLFTPAWYSAAPGGMAMLI